MIAEMIVWLSEVIYDESYNHLKFEKSFLKEIIWPSYDTIRFGSNRLSQIERRSIEDSRKDRLALRSDV